MSLISLSEEFFSSQVDCYRAAAFGVADGGRVTDLALYWYKKNGLPFDSSQISLNRIHLKPWSMDEQR